MEFPLIRCILYGVSGILAAGESLRILALTNFARMWDGQLVPLLAGCPNLEELYLAPFRVGPEMPLDFRELWPRLQKLRVLVLDLISPSGFLSPVSVWHSLPCSEDLMLAFYSSAILLW